MRKTLPIILLAIISLLFNLKANCQDFYIAEGFPLEHKGSTPIFLGEINNKAVMLLRDTLYGEELWEYDGTSTALVKDINPGKADAVIHDHSAIVHNDVLYFTAVDGTHGEELWMYDGETCEMVADIGSTHASDIDNFTVFNDTLFFTAYHPDYGQELHRVNNGEVELAYNLIGESSAEVANLFTFGDKLYLTASNGDVDHSVYYYKNGIIHPFHDPYPESGNANPSNFHSINSKLIYVATTKAYNKEICYYDTLTQEHGVHDIREKGNSFPYIIETFDSIALFKATVPEHGEQLYVLNDSGYRMLDDMSYEETLIMGSGTKYKGNLIFGAKTDQYGTDMFQFDGKTISIIKDVSGESEYVTPSEYHVHNDILYFKARSANYDQLFSFNGETITQITGVHDGRGNINPSDLFSFDGELYFNGYENGYQLHTTKSPETVTQNDSHQKSVSYTVSNNMLQFESEVSLENITIYSITGEVIVNTQNATAPIHLPTAKGIYIIMIEHSGIIETSKIFIR